MTPQAPPRSESLARPRAAIVAVAKNEGVYLHEWIAYHKVIGFDDVLVYDNDSTDGSSEMLAELAGHGLVTPIPWHVEPDVAPQTSAYRDGLERLGEDYGWIAFIDLDEFLVIPRHDTIADFLAEFGGGDAIGVNWKNFGSSGHERYSPEPVIDRFRRCSDASYGRNLRVKTLGPTNVLKPPTASVHKPKLKDGARFVSVRGEPIENGRSSVVDHDLIRLNHYYTKSAEEWLWKAARGRGGKPASLAERKHWYPDFEDRDRNEAVETDIVKRLPALLELMQRTLPRTSASLPPATREAGAKGGPEAERTDKEEKSPSMKRDRARARPAKRGRAAAASDVALDDDERDAEVAKQALPVLESLGWIASRRRKRPVDADFNPVPWYTYPAIAFVTKRVTPELNVFEFGSGLSTLWWADRVASVTSVEHHEGWYTQLTDQVPENVNLQYVELETDGAYCRSAAASGDKPFDVIVIDGRDRVNCARNCVEALSDQGVIIWDNADRSRYRPGFEYLAEQGFRRVPFIGFGPRLARLWETAVLYRDDNVFGL